MLWRSGVRASYIHTFRPPGVFLPDHWHAICGPVYPLTIFVVMKSIPLCGTSSMILVNRRREASGELWQERFFDPAPPPMNILGWGGVAPCAR